MAQRPVAVVTGAAQGIGRAIALGLAGEGYDIAGVDLQMESTVAPGGLREVKRLTEAKDAAFLAVLGDISDVEKHGALVSSIWEGLGRIDLLVNNAGVAPLERMDVLETTLESFDRVLGVNLRGTFFLTQVVVRRMIKNLDRISNYQPRVAFITSVSAEVSSSNRAEYCISKAGLSMVARVFADRLAGTGIKVYEIRPGIIQTDMTASVKEKYDRLIADGLVPQGRWGTPEDVAKAVVAIAKGYFDYSTGMVVEVSGGMNVRRL
jgi:3-oxoacyl-[acyl-carrier protein] reductase